MNYMEVAVADAAFHGNDALTYSFETSLPRGKVVIIPLRHKQILGIVVKSADRPNFKVKEIFHIPDLPALPLATLGLLHWLKSYYPAPFGVITQHFLPKQLPKKGGLPLNISSSQAFPDLPPLTSDQKRAIAAIKPSGTHLLHGQTGTGKTRVYIELAKNTVRSGRSAIILTPEIGLTSQLETDFRHIFGNRVIVIHSQLTEATKQRLWVSILTASEPLVILGPRSSLFCPLKNIGLIVLDESHETAYKQDQAPYYHTARVASALSSLHKAPLILGSATPLISDYYIAKAKNLPIITMNQTAKAISDKETTIDVVDLKDHKKFSKKSPLSDLLIKAIAKNLAEKKQTLLFLNRRGTARVIFCEHCGWQAVCPHCDLPLIYHGDSHRMRCHSCEYSTASPTNCPDCHNSSIVFRSIGTKAIVDEVTRLFPEARIMRFDNDNKKHERIEQHYHAIRDGEIDILIGTQTLAKGLDLPQLSLVGIIIADTSLYFPDFSAEERTFQLLSQVIGRVGRGHQKGHVIVQTYAPESPLLTAIISKNWDAFYKKEIAERQSFLFPPFCYLMKLTCRRASPKTAEKTARTFAQQLSDSDMRIIIEGPAPAFHEKVQNKYQWQLVIKAKERRELLRIIALLPSGWSYDIDPMNLL